ncbi:unnamed protein product [Allacma fusca]|uniref:Xylulose kinase n=1 Tax=Allacma fusca TaxID=39272 RepID=A0A8J2KBV6_9HEXA|nr:unnamed protein product [Allacma fusca]
MEPEKPEAKFYLGFDFGTQSVKATVVDDSLSVVHETGVNFDKDLPEFRTNGGVNRDERNPKIVSAPPIMWVKAVDILLEKLRIEGVAMDQIAGISGAAQQHGTVYWRKGAGEMLRTLDPSRFLHDALAFAFSVPHSPVWMDSSTTDYCDKLENALGGAEELSKLSGSRAYERFSGSQIAKVFHTKRDPYNATERISLISSFACSIFLGDFAPIDYSDGSGMNLLDIRNKTWSLEALKAVTSGSEEDAGILAEKLGVPMPTETVVGPVSNYFVERFGFDPECKVVAFTGDNPSSFAGMCLGPHDIAVSLGTSDTVFLSLDTLPEERFTQGHILINPIASKTEFMALLCFKNGSLTRERIRMRAAEGSWDIFNQLLDSTPRGNFGNIGFFFDLQEIIPKIKAGDHCFNKENSRLPRFTSKEVEVRALIEGQFLAKRVYAERIGCKIKPETRILATGGASSNHIILQVLSDVFNAPVYIQKSVNAADLGACYRVKHALLLQSDPDNVASFGDIVGDKHGFVKLAEPSKDAAQIYDKMTERFALLEDIILQPGTK